MSSRCLSALGAPLRHVLAANPAQVVAVCSLEAVMLVKGSLLRSLGVSRDGAPTEQSTLPVYLGPRGGR